MKTDRRKGVGVMEMLTVVYLYQFALKSMILEHV